MITITIITYYYTRPVALSPCRQKNVGVIKSSNLCTEILEYSDEKETAVCNLASIALPTFIDRTSCSFDYEKLHEVNKVITYNLNKVIDVNFYPTEKTRISNMTHRFRCTRFSKCIYFVGYSIL